MAQAAPPIDAGTVLAERYRLDGLLGRGGMGEVWEGRDLRLERAVAIKLILPHRVSDADAVARFLREARAAAALSHPGITTVHDVGQATTAQGPMPFLVMERLHGESLAARLERGALEPEAAADLGAALLEALAVAHGAGIVHRDIKPDNVFLRAPEGRPTLLDFGVARVIDGGDQATLTREGQSVGTPLYMAPEQLTGAPAGPAADLYAVGAMLYEAVTGRPTHRADGYAALVARKLTDEPDLTALRGAVGNGPFFDTVAAALQRDPARRPASATAMAAMLRGDGPGAQAVPPTRSAVAVAETLPSDPQAANASAASTPAGASDTPHRAAAPAAATPGPAGRRRSRVPLALTLVGVLGALIGVAAIAVVATGALGGPGDAPPPPEPPDVDRTDGLRRPEQALRILDRYHHASGADRTLLESPALWKQCVTDLEAALEQPDAPTRWRSALHFCQGMVALQETRTAEAVAQLEEAIRLEPERPDPHVALAHALAAEGHDDRAVAAAHEAARLEPDWWVPVAALGSIHGRLGREDEAIQAYRRALRMAPEEPRVLDSLALTYHAAHMDHEAAEQARRTLALDPDAPWSHLIEAERALERGDATEALASAESTLAVHPRSAAAVLARADGLLALGRETEARESFERVLELVGEEEATGLPEGRLETVRAALARGELPEPRATATRSRPRRRSRPTGRGSSRPPRSHPDDLGGLEL